MPQHNLYMAQTHEPRHQILWHHRSYSTSRSPTRIGLLRRRALDVKAFRAAWASHLARTRQEDVDALRRKCVSVLLRRLSSPLLQRSPRCFRVQTSPSISTGPLSSRGTTCCGRGHGAPTVFRRSAPVPLNLSTAAQGAPQARAASKRPPPWMRQHSEKRPRQGRGARHSPDSSSSPWRHPLSAAVRRPPCPPASVVCQLCGATATR